MDSTDKALAILVTAMGLGVLGSLLVGWPAAVSAAVAIVAIVRSPTPPAPGHEREGRDGDH